MSIKPVPEGSHPI